MTTTERPHGYARYKLDGCRCYICGFAVSEYRANIERQKAYGTWEPFVSGDLVRAHMRMLSEAGIGWKRVVALSGVSNGAVSKLMFGVKSKGRPPSVKVRAKNAEKIFAIVPSIDTIADCGLVSSVGTVRRLQALVRRGWPQASLAARLGMAPGNFSALLNYERVTAVRARAVRDLYEQLQNQDPADHGISAYGRSRATANAIRAGWPLPAMWDDDAIDDSAAFPDWTGECGTARGYTIHSRDRIPYCDPCRAAWREEAQQRKAAAMAASP